MESQLGPQSSPAIFVFYCLLVHSMIPEQLLQTIFYSPCPTSIPSLTSHYFTEMNAIQREQSSLSQLPSTFKNMCAFTFFLLPLLRCILASFFLISLQTLLPQLYLSTLTASISPSPLVPSCLQGASGLPDFKTISLDHDKAKAMVTYLFPPTAKPLRREADKLSLIFHFLLILSLYFKDSLTLPHSDITM